MVSSTVHQGFEGTLRQISALLTSFGYVPWVSALGTLPVQPGRTAFESCLDAVARCDVFLGIVRGYYGSGRVGDEPSITHQEFREAIRLNRLRFLAVEHDVTVARQVLKQFRTYEDGPDRGSRRPPSAFRPNAVLSDIRVVDMYEEAMRLDEPDYARRTDNWVQSFANEGELLEFVAAQLNDVRHIRTVLRARRMS